MLQNVTIKAVETETRNVIAEGQTGLEGSYGLWVSPSDIRGSKTVNIEAYVRGVRVFESPPMQLHADEELTFHVHVPEDALLHIS